MKDRQQMDRAPLTPHPQIPSIQNDVVATVHHQRDPQSQPTVRWGKVPPPGCRKLHGAERECGHRRERVHLGGERGAASNGSSDMAHSSGRHPSPGWSAPWQLKPETNRASVRDVAPRGSMTSTSENCPRRASACSSASLEFASRPRPVGHDHRAKGPAPRTASRRGR